MYRERWIPPFFSLALATSLGVGLLSAVAADSTGSSGASNTVLVPTVLPPLTDLERTKIAAAMKRPLAVKLREEVGKNLPKWQVDLEAIDKFPVPVLVSPRQEMRPSLRVFLTAQHYTATANGPGMHLEINGTRMPIRVSGSPHLPPLPPELLKSLPPDQNRPAINHSDGLMNVVITRTATGVDVSFMRFGSIYNLTVDCDEPSDKRCKDLGVLETALDLELIGGGHKQPS